MFEVVNSGMYTTIQDLGRSGFSHLGVKSLGAMDEYAYRWSQKLLGNCNANALEILLAGVKLKATANITISVCGANLEFKINGEKKPIWQTYNIYEDDIITFSKHINGMRAYLAIKDGFKTEKKYNSFSSSVKLNRGDFLKFIPTNTKEIRRVPKRYIPDYSKQLTLQILLSFQDQLFSKEQKEIFFNSDFEITPQISRMGYKLKGTAISPLKSGIISEGITFGAVQIPKDGQPIILLKDRQTIGGYPKIDTILASDCFKLSQLSIGSRVRFQEISIEKAEHEMRKFYDFFKGK